MINKTHGTDPQPFAGLTPEVVLDAAAAFGLAPDGRLFALNSYENRVYQLGAGDTQLVLKFYRPQRWSDAQIAEEHQFTAELATARSEEHTSELQSQFHLVCRLLLEKKKKKRC